MTEQRKRFYDKYFETMNGAQSAVYAGYSANSAREQAYQMLSDDEGQEYLQKLREEYAEKSGITKEMLIAEYKKIAFSDIRELYSSDGALLNIKQIDDDTAGAISGIKSREVFDAMGNKIGDIIEVKSHDKIRALDALGKTLGLFEKDNLQRKQDPNDSILSVKIVPPAEDED